MTIYVLLKILVVVFTEQLQEPERIFQHITHLSSLFSRCNLVPFRVLVPIILLVIEADADQTALNDRCDILEDDVLIVSLEDLEEGPLGDLASILEQLVGQFEKVDEKTTILSIFLLDDGRYQLCSPVFYHQDLMLVECYIALLYVSACRRKGAGEE